MDIEFARTDQSIYLHIVQSDDGTNPGEPLTGLDNTDIDDAFYTRTRGTPQTISVSALGAADAAHAAGGFIEVDAAKAPGLYRLDLPDAAVAYAADVFGVVVSVNLAGAANGIARPKEIVLAPPMREAYWRLCGEHVYNASTGVNTFKDSEDATILERQGTWAQNGSDEWEFTWGAPA